MHIRTLLALVTLLLTISSAWAEMYQWEDENGVMNFTATPPPESKKRIKVKVYNYSNYAPAPPPKPVTATRTVRSTAVPSPQPSTPQKKRFSGTVEMYVTDWCGYCKKARNYMDSKGIPYVAYNIERDSAANQRYKEQGGRGVPLIIIGSNKMSGFSPASLEYYLNNSR